jgi:hypothetical protein
MKARTDVFASGPVPIILGTTRTSKGRKLAGLKRDADKIRRQRRSDRALIRSTLRSRSTPKETKRGLRALYKLLRDGTKEELVAALPRYGGHSYACLRNEIRYRQAVEWRLFREERS